MPSSDLLSGSYFGGTSNTLNAIGWALAMVVIYFGASLPSTKWPMMFVIVTGGVTGIVAGLAIGGVTGAGLVWLLRDRYRLLAQVLLLRMLHFVFAAIFLICLIHIYACGLLGRLTPWILLSISLLAVEGVVLVINRGDCPLSALQRKLGDDRGFFGLFLPAWTLSTLRITYDGDQHCTALREPQGNTVAMDCPYTGKGEEFSSGNLVGSALAGCMFLSMGAVAQRDKFDLTGACVDVELTNVDKTIYLCRCRPATLTI